MKNRMHLDIRPPDSMQAEANRLVALGGSERAASRRRQLDRDAGPPEGNEFCVLQGPDDGRPSAASPASMPSRRSRRCGDAVSRPRARRRHRGDRGVHPPHLLRGRTRDHPAAPAGSDVGPHDARRDLRPDDRRGGRPKLDLHAGWETPGSATLHAIRRRIEKADPEPLEIEEYSHFGMVCRYMAGAANLPFFPIRSYYESDIPKVNPRIVPMTSPYDDGDGGLRGAAAPAERRDRHASEPTLRATRRSGACSGCRRRRRSPPNASSWWSRRSSTRPSSERDPNRTVIPGRGRRGGRGAVRVPSVVRPGLLRPRQSLLPRVGRDREGPGDARRVAGRVGLRDLANHHEYVEKYGDAHWDALRPEPARCRARSTTGGTRERRRGRPRVLEVRADDRGQRAPAGGRPRTASSASGSRTSSATSPSARSPPSSSSSTSPGSTGRDPERLPLSIGDPTLATGSTAVTSMFELFAFYLQAGLIDVAFLGRRADRPLREPQHDRDRRLRASEGAAARIGRACEIAIHARQVLVIMRQAQRSFVDRSTSGPHRGTAATPRTTPRAAGPAAGRRAS